MGLLNYMRGIGMGLVKFRRGGYIHKHIEFYMVILLWGLVIRDKGSKTIRIRLKESVDDSKCLEINC